MRAFATARTLLPGPLGRDLDAVRDGLGLGDRMTVLGHSCGATLGLRYALAHPDRARALVYVSGTRMTA